MAPMAVNKQTKNVDVSSKSVVLMTLDLGRQEASRYTPTPIWVDFTRKDGQGGKSERQLFSIDSDAGTISSNVHNKFLLRFALEPGKYEMQTVFGQANAFPFIASFQAPLLMEVNVSPKSVTYVGRVTALMRPRVGNEFRAGSVVPLVDQAAAGISGSTFDVTVVDASKEDVPEFKSIFSSLAAADIRTELLPAFDRAKAQNWWENGGVTKKPSAPSNIKEAQQ